MREVLVHRFVVVLEAEIAATGKPSPFWPFNLSRHPRRTAAWKSILNVTLNIRKPLRSCRSGFLFACKCLLGHCLRKKNPDRRRQVQHLTNFLDLAQRKFGFTSCLSVKCASAHVQKLAHFPDLDSLCLHSVVQCLRVHDVHLLCKCPLRHYIIIPFSNVKNYFCLLRYFYVA